LNAPSQSPDDAAATAGLRARRRARTEIVDRGPDNEKLFARAVGLKLP
jgi:hypothetical protein